MELEGRDRSGLDERVVTWSSILHALPIPAALIDPQGRVLEKNRWVEAKFDAQLVDLGDGDVLPKYASGPDGSRWRVRRVEDDSDVTLAIAERADVGDLLLRRFFATGDSLFVVYDQAGRIVHSNEAWDDLLGYGQDDVFGLDSWTLLPPDDLETRPRVEAELRESGRSEPRYRMRTAGGTYRLVEWALQYDTRLGRCFGIGRDITEEDANASELQRLAYTDELTGLPNRARLIEELETNLRSSLTPAVLFCDLDHFKVVNDSLGHHTGDALLRAIADRVSALATTNDSLFARLGGDEFVVTLADGSWNRAVDAAEEILASLEEPFVVLGRPLYANMSIGITVADQTTGRTAVGLLGEADTAAYKAKALGRNRFKIFDAELRSSVDRRFNVEAGLRAALDHADIEVHYQPIVALPGAGVVGVEALVRWRRGPDELVFPGSFIDVAEEAGLMPRIGLHVLRTAVHEAAEMARAGRAMMMSVNVSAAELSAGIEYVSQLVEVIDEAGLDPSLLLIEITESAVVAIDSILPTLHAIRAKGVRIGLDDFGTGFSSLSHLRSLPIDVVKVDRSFVVDLVDDRVTQAVTSSLVALCGALGLDVILEGIESPDHAAAAEQIGGTMAQGYLFHRPMTIAQLQSLLGLDRRRLAPQAQKSSVAELPVSWT